MLVTSRRPRQGTEARAGAAPPRPLSSARSLMAEGGPVRLLAVAAARLTAPLGRWGRLCFFRCETGGLVGPPGREVVREAVAAEVLGRLEAGRREAAAIRFAQGHRCFVVESADRVVSSVWATRTRAPIPEVGLDIVPGAGEYYFYDGYSLPSWRGTGAFRLLRRFVLRKLEAEGIRRVHFYIRGDNPRRCRRAAAWALPTGSLWYVEPRGGACRVYVPGGDALPRFMLAEGPSGPLSSVAASVPPGLALSSAGAPSGTPGAGRTSSAPVPGPRRGSS